MLTHSFLSRIFLLTLALVVQSCGSSSGGPGDAAVDQDQEDQVSDAGMDSVEDADAAEIEIAHCDVVGDKCLPSDTTIFVTRCPVPEGGDVRFGPVGDCGYCECGFIHMSFPCADLEPACGDWTAAPKQHPYCETGNRILCAHIEGLTTTPTRIGCCDEDGWVYCERDPLPDSNVCQ